MPVLVRKDNKMNSKLKFINFSWKIMQKDGFRLNQIMMYCELEIE